MISFVCIFCFMFVCESDVSNCCETQNNNSVCRYFKLDLESKLKNTTAWSARARRTQIKIKAYYSHHFLNKCASFLRGRSHSSTTRGRGNRIVSSSWPTVLFVSPQIKPLKFLQKGEDFTMFYIVSSVSLFCLLIFCLFITSIAKFTVQMSPTD